MAGALDGVRVLEAGEGKALAYAGKLLRDLGAEVIKVEPPAGDALRAYGPFPFDKPDPAHSGLFIFLNGGKRGARLDIAAAEGRAAFDALAADADVLLHSYQPAEAARLGLAPEALTERWPRLVVCALTPYGSTGPYADWRGYALQAQAGGGVAYRVGAPDREPLTSPLDAAEMQHGAVHAAVAVTLALVHRQRTGRGQFVDVGCMEAVAVAVAGIVLSRFVYSGTALPMRSGRRFAGGVWGLFATTDGDFDAITLLDRQWRKFIELMGDPAWGHDPRFAAVERQALQVLSPEDKAELVGLLEQWFAQHSTAEVWALTREARVSFQPVHSVPDVVQSEHMRQRRFFVEAPGPHPPLRVPGAPFRMSATPWQPPGPPPSLSGPPAAGWTTAHSPDAAAVSRGDAPALPLEGVRVVDLGQVWAGPLLGRYLADYGADVILVETARRPRAIDGGNDPGEPAAWEGLQRNRRSVQIDLTTPRGRELFRALLGRSDVMIDNFAARVMPSLGLGYEELHAEHPHLVIAALSAAGRSGPWSELLSYGPSLTALYGTKSLYGYPDDRQVMEDASDLDPIAGTYGMLAVMAALHHRNRTGEGQVIELAQGEAGFCAVAEAVIEHVWNQREMGPQGNRHRVLAPHGIYPCAGEDRWIAVACGSDEEWAALARAAGRPQWLTSAAYRTAAGRREARVALDAEIAAWTRPHDVEDLAKRLQACGVAAFPVMDVTQMLADRHHGHRRSHFELGKRFPADQLLDTNPWHFSAARPQLRLPTPSPGEHNQAVFTELLGLSAEQVGALQTEGVIA